MKVHLNFSDNINNNKKKKRTIQNIPNVLFIIPNWKKKIFIAREMYYLQWQTADNRIHKFNCLSFAYICMQNLAGISFQKFFQLFETLLNVLLDADDALF